MIPAIDTPWGSAPTFPLMVALGILAMLALSRCLLAKSDFPQREESFILPKIVCAGIAGLFSAGLCDALAKIRPRGGFQIAGISFYGGLIGAVICLYILLKRSKAATQYPPAEWFNTLTLPLIALHFWGRLGCFLGGCCYGKPTDSFWGVPFPDNAEQGIFHHGANCYPTQLFEAAALMILFVIVLFSRSRFRTYLLGYSIARFFIEFFRGDDRGFFVKFLSPAQLISLVLFACVLIDSAIKRKKKPAY